MVHFRHVKTEEQKIRKLFMERMFKARSKQEEKRKLKAYRQCVFGKYSTQVPSILWTPHTSFPLPSSTAKYKGKDSDNDDSTLPNGETLKECPFISGQQLVGNIILRPEEYYDRNNKESIETSQLCETIQLARQREGMDGSTTTKAMPVDFDYDDADGKDEGFEVTDLYDEELGFIRDVLKPPKRESIYNLGVEIFQQSGNNLHFEDAFRSMDTIHTFEDDNGTKTPNDSQGAGDDVSSVSTVLEDGDDDDGDDLISVLSALSEREERKKQRQQGGSVGSSSNQGIEITDTYNDEAEFVLQSWIANHQNSSNNGDDDGDEEDDNDNNKQASTATTSWNEPLRVHTETLKFDDEEGGGGNGDAGTTSCYPGIEITETFDAEAMFVQRSWKEDDEEDDD